MTKIKNREEFEKLVLSVTNRLAKRGGKMPLSEVLADIKVAQDLLDKYLKNLDPIKDKTEMESLMRVKAMLNEAREAAQKHKK